MHQINQLCEDLEKKLKLYSSSYQDESLKYFFEQEGYIRLAEIIINKDNENIQEMIDKLPDYYQNGIQYLNGKFDIRNDTSYICSQVYKQLYNIDEKKVFTKYLEIVQNRLNGDLDWFFELYFDFEPIQDNFLNHATEYIITNQNKNWRDEFQKIDYARYSWLRYIDIEKIPEKFDTREELFFWLKNNEQEEILDFLGSPLLNSLLGVIIRYEAYNINSHPFNKNRIIKILEKCSKDYIVIGQILTEKNISLNIFFLHFFEYTIFGFLNLYELDASPHNLQSENTNYTKEWNEIISREMTDVLSLHFSNLQNKESFANFIFHILNYMAKDYVSYFSNQYITNKKEYLLKEFIKNISSIEIRRGQYEKIFLMEFILDELITQQVSLLNTKQINLSDYYLLSFYLLEIEKLYKISDKDFTENIKEITDAILENLEQLFINNLQDDRLYIKFEFLEKIDFFLLYNYSKNKDKWMTLVNIDKVKDRWTIYDDERSSKNGISSSDPAKPENIIKLYFYILLQIFEKGKDNSVAKLLNKLAIEFGLKIDFGIFHDFSWMGHQFTEELFLKYIKVLNTFNDELFNDFSEELFNQKKLRDMLALVNYIEIDKRKKEVSDKIISYTNNEELELSSYYDIRESILYAQYNDLNELSTKLIKIYSSKIEDTSYNNNAKEFLEIKCKKEILDIFNNKDSALNEKFDQLRKYETSLDDRNYGMESKQTKCNNYKDFIRAMLFFETEPIKTYQILSELIDKELNSLYLINMINAYFKAYENNDSRYKYILNIYEKYDIQFQVREKSLYEYQVLFEGYSVIGDKDKLKKLRQEIPTYYENKIENYLPENMQLSNKSNTDKVSKKEYDRTYAIIISLEDYAPRESDQVTSVKYANKDANLFKSMLIDYMDVLEKDITIFINDKAMKSNLEYDLQSLFYGLTERDRLIFYYVGHGFHDGTTNYLSTYDMHPFNVTETAISLRKILLDPFSQSKCKSALVFIDACAKSIKNENSRTVLSNMDDTDLFQVVNNDNLYAATFFSCQAGQSSYSCDVLNHGIWTYHLNKAISGEESSIITDNKFISDISLRDYLTSEVYKYTKDNLKREQNPKAVLDADSEFVLVEVNND